MTEYIDLDVRPILRAGGEPFSVIMAAVDSISPGQGIRLFAPFKPVPLFGVMAGKGFDHSETDIGGGEWQVLFTPMEAPPPAPVPAASIGGSRSRLSSRTFGSTTGISIRRSPW